VSQSPYLVLRGVTWFSRLTAAPLASNPPTACDLPRLKASASGDKSQELTQFGSSPTIPWQSLQDGLEVEIDHKEDWIRWSTKGQLVPKSPLLSNILRLQGRDDL
jgi:hypothetical protein